MIYILFIFLILYQILIIIFGSIKDFNKYKINFKNYIMRFGFSSNLKKIDYLIHAVSCGEAMSCQPLINKIQEKKKKFLLSVHTPTGFNLIKKKVKKTVLKPFDTIPTMLYFLIKTRPKVLFIAESDTWPFMIIFSKMIGTKIYYINYKKKGYFRNIYHYLIADKIFLKIDSNLKDNKYVNLGNLKWLSTKKIEDSKYDKTTIIISSAGKDEIDIHLKLIKNFPKINFIYVPRHLNWESHLKEKLESKQLNYYWLDNSEKIDELYKHNFTIVWTFGLLNKLYAKTHICLMGDTFNSVGGHNLVEPAIHQNAIILGPNYYTCQDLAEELEIVYAKNFDDLYKKLLNLLNTKSLIKLHGDNNYKIVKIRQNHINDKLNLLI